ncbi:hypothetical protein C8J56DRAFT_48733 [Mycena floridula]|nr:hypothetical protein C8J56DRAFT_48733 [Mycena floridula]
MTSAANAIYWLVLNKLRLLAIQHMFILVMSVPFPSSAVNQPIDSPYLSQTFPRPPPPSIVHARVRLRFIAFSSTLFAH